MSKSIASVLALAVTTSLAFANGGGDDEKKANPFQSGSSWKPGAGITLADSDEFGLRLANQLQVQWAFTANDNSPDGNTFNVRRARTTLMGHAFNKDLTYMLRLDATDDVNVTTGSNNGAVKDAWAQWAVSKNEGSTIGVRVGQGKTYHGLEATGSSTGLFFVERSATTRTFSDARSTGAWVHGSHNENKLRWTAGAQNGDVAAGAGGLQSVGEEAANSDNELCFVASVSFDPMGDVTGGKTNEAWKQGDLGDVKDTMGTIGAGVMIGNDRDGTAANANDVESTSININTAWAFGGGLTAQGEVFIRSDDQQGTGGVEEDTQGWYAQGTYTLPKDGNSNMQWGFGVRVNMVETDNTVNFLTGAPALAVAGDVTEISGVVNAFYHGHACKTQIELTSQDVSPDAGGSSTNTIIRVQFQLLF